MQLVTLNDKMRVMRAVVCTASRRDQRLLSLARQTTWTERQRALVDKLIAEAEAEKRARRLACSLDSRPA